MKSSMYSYIFIYYQIGESHDGRHVGPGLRSINSYEEPTRDPDVWPAPPPKDPDVWSAPTSTASFGQDSNPRVRPVRGPRKSESVAENRGSSNRAASRNAKGPGYGDIGNARGSKKSTAKDNTRSGAAANKEKGKRNAAGGAKATTDKEKVRSIYANTHDIHYN